MNQISPFTPPTYDDEVQRLAAQWRYPQRGNPNAPVVVLGRAYSLFRAYASS